MADPDAGLYPGSHRGRTATQGLEIPTSVLAAVEGILNCYLALDPEGAQGFTPIHGRIIGIEIQGPGSHLTLVPGPDRLQLFGPYEATPDCLIRGTPVALLRMITARRKDLEIGEGAVEIEGDSTIAHELAKAFSRLDLDWEEQLARMIGDPLAHPIGELGRGLARWGRRTSETLNSDLKEYLEEESRLVPTRYELQAFLGDVDTLRDDVERLEARLDRLARAPRYPATPGAASGSRGSRGKGAQADKP